MGAAAVTDKDDKLLGIITDGDLRRMLEHNKEIDKLVAYDIMTLTPKTIGKNELAINAFNLMEKNNITQLAVVEDDKFLGLIHLHDILKEGIV